MLKKLFYYDFRALARYMIPTVCIVLGICLLAGVFLSIYMANTGNSITDVTNPIGTVLSLSVGMVYLFLIFGLLGAVLAFYIIYILRVRTHMYGDEGYLTLTVPATPHEFTLSKLFSGTLWFYITALAVVIGAIVAIVIPIMFIPGMFGPSGSASQPVALTVTEVIAWIVYPIAYAVVVPIAQVMFLQATVSFGSLLAGKAHIGISIVFYMGVNFVMSLIQSILSGVFLTGTLVYTMDYGLLMIFDGLTVLLLYGGLGVATYFLNVYLLKHKVNLE